MNELAFEWDEGKNRENRRKHGVAFEEARSVFFDPQAVESGIPYQNLINLYLRDCVEHHRKLDLKWAS